MAFWNIPNTFATQTGNVSASLLDANFSSLAVSPIPCSVGGTANAITLTPLSTTLTLTSYAAGMSFIFEAVSTNTSTTVTIALPGLAAVPVQIDPVTLLAIGQINAGSAYVVYYDGTDFMLIGATPKVTTTQNRIINGGFRIDQRNIGVAQAAIATSTYMSDRWVINYSNAAVVTAQRTTDAPSSPAIWKYSQSITVTTADAAVAAGDFSEISQYIEGYNITDLIGQTFTLQFWVKSSKTGIHCVAFRNSGNDRSYVMEYSITAANTWQQVSLTVSGGLTTAGTWNYTTSIGLKVDFCMMSGSTYQTTANAWQTGNFLSTASQVNVMDTIGNAFKIAGVALYLGASCPTYEERNFEQELAMCQRYYQKSYNQSSSPGATSSTGAITASSLGSVNQLSISRAFVVTMRSTPTITWYSYATGASGNIRNATTAADLAVTNTNSESQNNTGFPAVSVAPTAGQNLYAHYIAESEL